MQKTILKGTLQVPGDKSISHRALIFSLLAVPLAATARILFREFLYPHVRRIAGLDEPQPLLGNDPTAGA